MKISNNALNFLLAQYRAIFKRAYIKGIASAVILTAGLAAGQAQADSAKLEEGNNYYFYDGSNWSEKNNGASGAYEATKGIVAGAIGGNGLSGTTISPEQNSESVTGGTLAIDGVGGKSGSLAYISSGTAAGGWAQANTGNITATGNSVSITGAGKVTSESQNNRGLIYGAYAKAADGIAYAFNNTVTIDKGASGATAAADRGIYGAQALGHKGAQAIGNIVQIDGEADDGKQKQNISFWSGNGVIGGYAVTSGSDSTGTYQASDNQVILNNISGSAADKDNLIVIYGSYIDLQGASGAQAVASNTTLSIGDSVLTATSGGVISAIRVQSTDSGNASVNGNGVGLTIANSSITNSSGAASSNSEGLIVAGASVSTKGDATVTNSVVNLSNTEIIDQTTASNETTTIHGASIVNSGTTATATGNKVTISEESSNVKVTNGVVAYEREIDSSVVGALVQNGSNSGTFTLSDNAVDVGANVKVNGGVYGAHLTAKASQIEKLTANNNSVSIAGDVTGDVIAVHMNAGSFTTSGSAQFLNNDVTLKTGGKVQSGSIVGGAGKDSAITIETGSTYIASNASQDLASDVININGTVTVEDGKELDISGFYQNGLNNATNFHDNLTTIGSSSVIENAGTINLYGKAVVDQGATLTGTIADSKIVVNAAHGLDASNKVLLTDENKVAGADQGTLAIYKNTLQRYLKADKIGSATTADSEGSVELASGGVLELRDTSNIDLATEFNFTTAPGAAGSIVLDTTDVDVDNHKGSVIRGNDITISKKLASNAVDTVAADPATTYEGLNATETKGLQIEANSLTLGATDLESWQSEEIKFGKALFRDQLSFLAVNNDKEGSNSAKTLNDGYHLVSEVVGDHYSALQEQGTSLTDKTIDTYYQAEDGVIEGDVTIKAGAAGAAGTPAADDGKLVIRNGNFKADDEITIASGGSILVGGGDGIDGKAPSSHPEVGTPNAPDATLVLGQALTFDLSDNGADVTVTVEGAQNSRYDADLAAETVGDDRHVVLDLRKGITLVGSGANKDTLNGAATIDVKSGGEVLLTAPNLNSLLAQNADINNNSGSIFKASSGGAFIVEGDVDATFDDFNAAGTHGISLSNKGYLVADSLTIDNSNLKDLNTSKEETAELLASGTVNWGNGTVVVQDLEISNLQLTTGDKPEGASAYASQVTLANGTAKISSSLLSYNQTLKLGVAGEAGNATSGNLVFFTSDATSEGTISVL